MLFPRHTRHSPALGPLCQLFFLTGILFTQIPAMLVIPSMSSFLKSTLSVRFFLTNPLYSTCTLALHSLLSRFLGFFYYIALIPSDTTICFICFFMSPLIRIMLYVYFMSNSCILSASNSTWHIVRNAYIFIEYINKL